LVRVPKTQREDKVTSLYLDRVCFEHLVGALQPVVQEHLVGLTKIASLTVAVATVVLAGMGFLHSQTTMLAAVAVLLVTQVTAVTAVDTTAMVPAVLAAVAAAAVINHLRTTVVIHGLLAAVE
tara:strand:- start:438 stop:806 length:369 start_codon:yes stop_codon:yes gene_type:complete